MHGLIDIEVQNVVDGDTVNVIGKLAFGRVKLDLLVIMRLGGINAPEKGTDAGKAAKQALVEFIATHPGPWSAKQYGNGQDKYGRWLSTLIAPDGTDVNQWMLDHGHAVVDK